MASVVLFFALPAPLLPRPERHQTPHRKRQRTPHNFAVSAASKMGKGSLSPDQAENLESGGAGRPMVVDDAKTCRLSTRNCRPKRQRLPLRWRSDSELRKCVREGSLSLTPPPSIPLRKWLHKHWPMPPRRKLSAVGRTKRRPVATCEAGTYSSSSDLSARAASITPNAPNSAIIATSTVWNR
jgi:hypothetical protein